MNRLKGTAGTLLRRPRGHHGMIGNAFASIDLNNIGPIVVMLAIAWAILDDSAPLDVAYLPDTISIRI